MQRDMPDCCIIHMVIKNACQHQMFARPLFWYILLCIMVVTESAFF